MGFLTAKSSAKSSSARRRERGYAIARSNGGFPFMLLIASIVVMIAASVECDGFDCANQRIYVVLVFSIVSFFVALLYLCCLDTRDLGSTCTLLFTLFFFICWGVLAGYGTFEAPFTVPGNGYFASWFGFLAATGLLVVNVSAARAAQNALVAEGLPMCMLLIGSVVVILAGWITGGGNSTESIVAIVGGTVSLIFAIFSICCLCNYLHLNAFCVVYFMVVWWLVITLWLTFTIFKAVGNGYFGCWVCFIASAMLARFI